MKGEPFGSLFLLFLAEIHESKSMFCQTITSRKNVSPNHHESLLMFRQNHTSQNFSLLPQYTESYSYGFNGKEMDNEFKGTGNSINYDARIYDPRLGRFLSVDAMYEKSPHLAPYVYTSNCPVYKIDINGDWDIEIHGYADREKYGYGVAIVKDANGVEIMRFQVLLRGTNGPSRGTKGDTPTGTANIAGWRNDGSRDSYGPNPRLEFVEPTGSNNKWGQESRTGEWKENDRQNIQMHGEGRNGADECSKQTLKTTHGCIRAHNTTLFDLKQITDNLQRNNPCEAPGKITITDDLIPSCYNGVTYYYTPSDISKMGALQKTINNLEKTKSDLTKKYKSLVVPDGVKQSYKKAYEKAIDDLDKEINKNKQEKENIQKQYVEYERGKKYVKD